jgi:tRNA (cytidine/uridine-2'-O-)-methyltransferase
LLHIILFEPEIPPNTGNIIRLSVNTGFNLHLIKPLGFSVDEKSLRRAGMDYIRKTDFNIWESLNDCLKKINYQSVYSISTKGEKIYSDLKYEKEDAFIFGPETTGLPQKIIDQYNSIKIPMKSAGRSINLSNAVSIIVYEAWRQLEFI